MKKPESVPKLTLTPMAREDLKGIGRYTQSTWGIAQRNTYLNAIATTFANITDGILYERPRNDIKSGVLSCPCNKHIIFFRRDADGDVQVLRILHSRMEFTQHL